VGLSLISKSADEHHTILTSERINHSLLSLWIILPDSIGIEPVFMPARVEIDADLPVSFFVFLHGLTMDVPVIEVPGQRYGPGFGGKSSKTDLFRLGLSAFHRFLSHHSFSFP
jgi:hypothetical protein